MADQGEQKWLERPAPVRNGELVTLLLLALWLWLLAVGAWPSLVGAAFVAYVGMMIRMERRRG